MSGTRSSLQNRWEVLLRLSGAARKQLNTAPIAPCACPGSAPLWDRMVCQPRFTRALLELNRLIQGMNRPSGDYTSFLTGSQTSYSIISPEKHMCRTVRGHRWEGHKTNSFWRLSSTNSLTQLERIP